MEVCNGCRLWIARNLILHLKFDDAVFSIEPDQSIVTPRSYSPPLRLISFHQTFCWYLKCEWFFCYSPYYKSCVDTAYVREFEKPEDVFKDFSTEFNNLNKYNIPHKLNIATQHVVSPFKIWLFWVSMLIFGGAEITLNWLWFAVMMNVHPYAPWMEYLDNHRFKP